MDLKEIREEINEAVEQKRKELDLTFVEKYHTYYMKDVNGVKRSSFPSVSKIVKKYFPPFDQQGIAMSMTNNDPIAANKLIAEWKEAGSISTNLGSRTHFLLEENLIGRYGGYKDLRQPEYSCDPTQVAISDKMVGAGIEFLDLMEERGAVLLDTEMILGHPELGYVGQPDNSWLMMNKAKDNFGLVVTDWKTNKPKNFESHHYTKKMYAPFQNYDDIALNHYNIQIPLYGRLLMKMLEGTKFNGISLLGGVIVLLKDDGTFTEFRVPKDIINKVFTLKI